MAIDPVQIVDAAIASGRVHPRARDRWLCDLAAGGRRGGKALATLLALTPGPPGRTARAGSGQPRPASGEQLYRLLYPSAEDAAAESDRIIEQTGRAAEKFAEQAQQYDNSLAVAEGIAARTAAASATQPVTESDLYTQLFGRDTGGS